MNQLQPVRPWYERIPHAVTLLFGILVLVALMTYVLPAGTYDRVTVDGRSRVVPGSYEEVASSPVGFLELFRSIPLGFAAAAEIIFVVLAGGIMFGILEKSKALENGVGTLVKTLGERRRGLIIVLMTFVFGGLGVAVGYENNIALVPIAAVLSLAIGGDLVLAAGISVAAITIGFGLSPINPYTVGTGQKIAELPLFSGAWLRALLCFTALAGLAWYNLRYARRVLADPARSLGAGLQTEGLVLSRPLIEYRMTANNWLVLATFLAGLAVGLYGVFVFGWYINELSAIFLMIALAAGLVAGFDATRISEEVLNGVAAAAPGAFMVGYATSIKVLMETGRISDTISFQLSELLQGLPLHASAIAMSASQCIINFFIPSGSGQALASLPVMIPLGDLLGLTRQTTILAYQIGDGVTNLVNPTLGGLIAMLSMCRVPLDRWLRFIFPVLLAVLLLSWLALLLAVAVGYR